MTESTAERTVAGRPRRSCLAVPGSSPKMLDKARSLPADQVFLDLEDSVAPNEKEASRSNIVEALKLGYDDKTVVVRINAIDTRWAYRDIIEVVEGAGDFLDCIMIPKVQTPGEVEFVDHLLRMVEDTVGIEHRIGIEAQIENAPGLTNIDDIAVRVGAPGDADLRPRRHGRRAGDALADGRRAHRELPRRPLALGADAHPRGRPQRRPAGDRRALRQDPRPRRLPRGRDRGRGPGVRRQVGPAPRPDADRQRGLRPVGQRTTSAPRTSSTPTARPPSPTARAR